LTPARFWFVRKVNCAGICPSAHGLDPAIPSARKGLPATDGVARYS